MTRLVKDFIQEKIQRKELIHPKAGYYPTGVFSFQKVKKWKKVQNLVVARLCGDTIDPIVVSDTGLLTERTILTGVHRWVANEVLAFLDLPKRIDVVSFYDWTKDKDSETVSLAEAYIKSSIFGLLDELLTQYPAPKG